jgi:hypothetical protein
MSERSLRWAATGFACATAYNSAVAIREDLPGEPFGARVPISVPTGILTGWGSCVAAPWPMPVLGLLAVRRPSSVALQGRGQAGLCVRRSGRGGTHRHPH